MPTKKEPELSPVEILKKLSEGLAQQVRAPNMYMYTPHAKQMEFHCAQQQERLFVAGNRSGKSLASVLEGIWYATGKHPYRNTPAVPTRGRVVGVDFLNGIDKILLPLYKQWMPAEFLIDGEWAKSYSQERHTLTLNNGSFIEFMSQDQDLDKFAGTSRHWIHFDEECPKMIFEECLMRLIDTDGDWWISETPVAGMEWIYDDLYEPAKEGRKPELALIEAEMGDNPHITKHARDRLLGMFGDEERLMREKGQYTTVSGQLFKLFSNKYASAGGNVITPQELDLHNSGLTIYLCGDHGYNAPTAWLWVAVTKDGNMTVFHEHYQAEMVVAEHAAVIHEVNTELRKLYGIEVYLTIGDPAMNQRQGVTGDSIVDEYARHGIYVSTKGITRDKMVGINKINQYLRPNPKRDNLPYLMFTDNCVNVIREMKGAKRARIINKLVAARKNAPEGILEKDDHAIDALRYLVTLLPDLTTPDFAISAGLNAAEAGIIPEYRETFTGYDRRTKNPYGDGWSSVTDGHMGLE